MTVPKLSVVDGEMQISERLFFLEVYEQDGQYGLFVREPSVVQLEDSSSYDEWKTLLSSVPLSMFSYSKLIEVLRFLSIFFIRYF